MLILWKIEYHLSVWDKCALNTSRGNMWQLIFVAFYFFIVYIYHCCSYYQISMALKMKKRDEKLISHFLTTSIEIWWKKLYFGVILILELTPRSATNLSYGLRHWNTTGSCNNFLTDQTTQLFHVPRCPNDLDYCQQQRLL